MSCCGGNCSCGKGSYSPEQESVYLAQLSTSQGKLTTFDWMSDLNGIKLHEEIVEVRFKNNRKEFCLNNRMLSLKKDDRVVVDVEGGHDVGTVSLTGDLAVKQYERRGGDKLSGSPRQIYRKALQQDLDKWLEAKKRERETLIRVREIAHQIGLEMSIGDVEFQGDNRKVTIFYTAEGRVDFRELIKAYAAEFRVKIEMRQIGARQEAAKLGGLGSCGRELCCSTWKTEMQSVKTEAARKQNLSLNVSKLAGQCGKLKCCLNYELEMYLEAWDEFPAKLIELETKQGTLVPVQPDLLKGVVYYSFTRGNDHTRFALPIEQVKKYITLNKKGTILDTKTIISPDTVN